MDISMHKFIINGKASKLPPGFWFHPEERELVFEYLAKKVFKQPMNFTLPEVDSYNVDPWDLLGERDREKYFFVKKKETTQDAGETASGYWEEFGPEKEIEAPYNSHNYPMKGIKKTLAFYIGKKPQGLMTEWVMEEFCLGARPSYPHHQEESERWMAVRLFMKIEESEDDDDTDVAESSLFSFCSVDDESDGEEVIQSK